MTYRELIALLQELDETQLDQDVTVYDYHLGEYTAVVNAYESDTDVLDEGHFVLELEV